VTTMSVCLSVCEHSISRELAHVTYDRGLIFMWRLCDTLCTSGFTDDVMFVHDKRRNSDSMRSRTDQSPWRIRKLTHQGAALGRGGVCYLRLPSCSARKAARIFDIPLANTSSSHNSRKSRLGNWTMTYLNDVLILGSQRRETVAPSGTSPGY